MSDVSRFDPVRLSDLEPVPAPSGEQQGRRLGDVIREVLRGHRLSLTVDLALDESVSLIDKLCAPDAGDISSGEHELEQLADALEAAVMSYVHPAAFADWLRARADSERKGGTNG